MEFLTTASQLGGTVFTVCAFLWYLIKVSDKQVSAQIALAKALQRLADTVALNTMRNKENTTSIEKNVDTVKDNTKGIKENTDTIKQGNGHK